MFRVFNIPSIPSFSIQYSSRRWWRFAISVHLESIRESNRRQTKEFICGRAKNNALYAKGYTQKLTSYYGTDYYLRPVMETVERDYSYQDIRIIREAVHDKLKADRKQTAARDRRKSGVAKKFAAAPTPTSEPKKSPDEKSSDSVAGSPTTTAENSQAGWLQWAFPSWGGWGSQETPAQDTNSATTETTSTTTTTTTTSAEEAERIIEEEVWNMVTETSAESASLLKKDVVFAHVNFRLDSGTIQLVGDKQQSETSKTATTSPTSPSCQPSASSSSLLSSSSTTGLLLRLDFWKVAFVLESRPRTASSLFSLSLGSVRLQVDIVNKIEYDAVLISLSYFFIHIYHHIALGSPDSEFALSRTRAITSLFPGGEGLWWPSGGHGRLPAQIPRGEYEWSRRQAG